MPGVRTCAGTRGARAYGMDRPTSEFSLSTVTMAVILATTLGVGLIMVMVVLLRS
ncbi:MAG: hypothetical protein SFX73_23830 [Kofleriaceae bacterium]|nr:hypothetical protein [Kofleriaceae bacterium]